MGESARRKDLVEDVRKKIGEEAAAAVATLEQQLNKLQLEHRSFVFEIEGMRKQCALAKAAPAELRRDVRTFQADLSMKAEQIENLGQRTHGLNVDLVALGALVAQTRDDYVRLEVFHLMWNLNEQRRADMVRRLARLERLTLWQRLRFLVTGRLPKEPTDGTSGTDQR